MSLVSGPKGDESEKSLLEGEEKTLRPMLEADGKKTAKRTPPPHRHGANMRKH